MTFSFFFSTKIKGTYWLPNNKSAHAKFPINKWVGERNAKSTHNAIRTRIFPSTVNTIIIAKDKAINIVRRNGRDGSLIFGSDRNDDAKLSFELFNAIIWWNWDRTCMWIIHME